MTTLLCWGACLGFAYQGHAAEGPTDAPDMVGVGRLAVEMLDRSETGLQSYDCPAVLIAPDVALFDASCLDPLLKVDVREPGPAKFGKYKATFILGQSPDFSGKVTDFRIHSGYRATRCSAYHPDEASACEGALKWCRQVFAKQVLSRKKCEGARDVFARTLMHRPLYNQALAYLDNIAENNQVAPLAREDNPWFTPGAQVDAVTVMHDGSTSLVPVRVVTRGSARKEVVVSAVGVEDQVAFLRPRQGSENADVVLAIPSHPTSLPTTTPLHFTQYTYGRVAPAIPWILATMDAGCISERMTCVLPTVLEPAPTPAPSPMPPPAPAPAPTPTQSPAPAPPSPVPPPAPRPSPMPPPAPTPAPTPRPAPAPSPAPAPTPTASPSAGPAPAPDPGPPAPHEQPDSRRGALVPHAVGCQQAGALAPWTAALMLGYVWRRRRRASKQ